MPCKLVDALATVSEHRGPAIFVFMDAQLNDPEVARRVRDMAWLTGGPPRSLVFVAPDLKLDPTLGRIVPLLELSPPDRTELKGILSSVASRCSSLVGVELQLDGEAPDRLADAARGLTSDEAERAFIRALLQVQRLSAREVPLILSEKKRVFEHDPLLKFITATETLDDLGGLDTLRAWLRRRGKLFTSGAEPSAPVPRGMLLIGMPGCGRSSVIRAAANAWEIPLVRLDCAAIIEGTTEMEGRLSRTLRHLEHMAPCMLWLPSLDRFFERGSDTEGGIARSPVALRLDQWLRERESSVFVVATADDHERLPLDLLWKQAFDEVFFIDFPSSEERRQILQLQLKRRGLLSAEMNLEMLVAASEGFSGVQVERAIARGVSEALEQGRAIKMVDIVQSLRQMTPMAGFMAEARRRLRGWAHRRAIPASPTKES
jgi:hypothetical protein